MSLIAEALKKAGVAPLGSPSPLTPRPPRWIWGALLAGGVGFLVILLARSPASRFPGLSSATPQGASTPAPLELASQPVSSPPAPMAAKPLGLKLLHSTESSWKLNGVLEWGDGKGLALINGKLVEQGQSIQGARLVRVAKDRVDLEVEGEVRTLTLR